MKQSLSLTYEPLTITKLVLQIYLEKTYDRNENYPKTVRFAVAEFMRTLEDSELESILSEYVTNDNVECITFEDDKDCERITHYFMLTDRFKDLVYMYEKQGYDGLGVADNTSKTFYSCEFGEHWQTVGFVLRENHEDYGKAFDQIMYGNKSEYNGIRSADLDSFILNNLELVGGNKALDSYLADR